MKKINFKQPKYILPLVIILPLTFFVYEISSVFGGGGDKNSVIATDSLNTSLPDADSTNMDSKMKSMSGRYNTDDAMGAVNGFGEEYGDGKDSLGNEYTDSEMDDIDRHNAELKRQQAAERAMEESLANSRRHINSYENGTSGNNRGNSRNSGSNAYGSSSYGSSYAERNNDLEDYAKELEMIQRRSQEAQRAIDRNLNSGYYDDDNDDGYGGYSNYGNGNNTSSRRGNNGSSNSSSNPKGRSKSEEKTAIVKKVADKNAAKFNTVSQKKDIDAPLIKAMIDKTTKAHEGTRLRFKLLDDVTINNITLKKGTYIYGLVTGFGQQRVKAEITSILHGNKFIKVHLSVYDNDGMEGFYVPESAFRDMMKEAGAQAAQQQIQLNSGYGSELNGENVALQALQNLYQSGSQAVSANIRKNKARIKYNTIVYLINTSNE